MSRNCPGEARYGIHSIDHFTLEVPSLEKARSFFTQFGLDVMAEGPQLALRSFGNAHVWMRFQEGPSKRMAYLGLLCYAEEFEELVAQIQANGARPAPSGADRNTGGFWFLDPDCNLIQLKIGPKTTLSGLAPRADTAPRAGQRGMVGGA